MSEERMAILVRVVFYSLFGVLLLATNLVVDYTKVRIVVEDRHSVLGALVAALRFIRSHARQVIALYLAHAAYVSAAVPAWPDSPAAEAVGR
jgi:hypothetical protein